MVKLIFFCCSLLVIVWSQSIHSFELNAEQAMEMLSITPEQNTNGTFKQKKFFKVLATPFISTGFYRQTSNNFKWVTTEPVRSTLIFDGEKLWQQNGSEIRVELPLANHYINVVKALIKGDLYALKTYFSFKKSKVNNCITLLPLDNKIALIGESIQFCYQGKRLSIRINESSGNYTDLKITPADKSVEN
ncbi:outer membrane lipoprotein carrier protein LolA [Thalassotalea sp. 1_MG-2023]|uniref:outer membrane lipoprotein carrier protein LolA n=1 Tax=Thalassotalea sp. 1_MG-2023 TaxID=3062680 RepID=UPI0026E2E904|nr:outer membrane lipoprotein carrier protein LolA [Thalassotalea sp. 1_MG-2023]MDO6426641.1 outer membrane lipoprotein carrier protein LolA [Thalassotalea sp. 1_MG-2023]